MNQHNQSKTAKALSRILSRIFLIGITIFFVTVLLLMLLCEPNIKLRSFVNLDTSTFIENQIYTVHDKHNEPIHDIFRDRITVSIHQVPKHTINAFVSIEDHRYFDHHGIDLLRILRASVTNITQLGYKEGGSTITQQLIKNTHLNNNKNISRKINEIRIARDIERKYSKEFILEQYFNILYFGRGIYGIGTAARIMFGKNISSVSINESAILAAIINNPGLLIKDTKALYARKNLVIDYMHKYGFVDTDTANKTRLEKVKILDKDNTFDALSVMIQHELQEYTDNFVISSSIDATFVREAARHIRSSYNEDYNVAFVLRDKNSIIAAYAKDTIDLYNTKRQPGSAIKPIIAYAPCIENNTLSPLTPVLDKKTSFGGYTPKNIDNKYRGWISAQDALAYSRNVPAVQLLQDNGIEVSKQFAEGLGIEFEEEDDTLTLALGGMRKGITLTQLVDAYSAFGNMGKFNKSRVVTSLSPMHTANNESDKNKASSSTQQYRHSLPNKKNFLQRSTDSVSVHPSRTSAVATAMRDDTAHIINDMLKRAAKIGTAKGLSSLDFSVAAKTGTVGGDSYNTDAYCIAYTSEHTLAVWVGGINMPNSTTGGTTPTYIAKDLLSILYKDNKPRDFKKSSNTVQKNIDNNELYKRQRLALTKSNKNSTSGLFSRYNLPPFEQSHLSDYQRMLDEEKSKNKKRNRANSSVVDD